MATSVNVLTLVDSHALEICRHLRTICIVGYIVHCRFLKPDLKRLAEALHLPEKYRCEQATAATGMEALLILLRRLAYPNRWCDLVPLFGRSECELNIIFDTVS